MFRVASSGKVGVAAGVRLNRGAGDGCKTPSSSTKVARSRLWGCSAASRRFSTGAKHASVPSRISHHSERLFEAKIDANRRRTSGHRDRSC